MPTTYLQPGSTNTAAVKQLQDYLVQNKYLTQAQVDTGYGTYGPQTTAAVAALQKAKGVDNSTGIGYYGPRTIAALNGATPAQSSAIGASVDSGNTNPLGIPSNMGNIFNLSVPTPSTPVPLSGLNPANNVDINSILGPSATGAAGSSNLPSVNGILSLYGADLAGQAEYNKKNSDLTTLMTSLGGEGGDLTKALGDQGVPDAAKNLSQLNIQAAQLKGDLDKFDAETTAGLTTFENQPVTAHVVAGQQAQYQKQRDLTRLAKAAELSATVALAQAYQGNIDTGTKLAQQAVDLKYQPILNQISVLQQQIKVAGDTLNSQDSKRGSIISALLSAKSNELSNTISNQKQIQTLAVQAAANGAPLSVINAIKNATDPAIAAQAGSQYLKGNLETTTPGGNGGQTPTKSGTLTYTAQDYADDSQALDASRGSDNFVDPTLYQNLYKSWIAGGGRLEDFIAKFPPKNYVNPKNTWLPSYLMPPSSSSADLFNSL